MWDLVLIKKSDDYYIVMTPNGDTHCIDEETYQRFLSQNRIKL